MYSFTIVVKAIGKVDPSLTESSRVRSYSKSGALAEIEPAFDVEVAIGAHSICEDGATLSECLHED